MKSDKVCSPRSPDRNRSKVVGSRVSADLREIAITKSRPRWCRTVLEGRQDRETREKKCESVLLAFTAGFHVPTFQNS